MASVLLKVPVTSERCYLCAWSRAPELVHPSFVRGLADLARRCGSCEELVALWAWLLEVPRPPKGCGVHVHLGDEPPWPMLFRPPAAGRHGL